MFHLSFILVFNMFYCQWRRVGGCICPRAPAEGAERGCGNLLRHEIYKSSVSSVETGMLHWSRVPERIEYKLCVLVYRCLQYTAPEYLANSFQRVSDVTTRRHLRSAQHHNLSYLPPAVQHLATERFLSPLHAPGTLFCT